MVGAAEWQEQRQVPQLDEVVTEESGPESVREETRRGLAQTAFGEKEYSNVVLGYN